MRVTEVAAGLVPARLQRPLTIAIDIVVAINLGSLVERLEWIVRRGGPPRLASDASAINASPL